MGTLDTFQYPSTNRQWIVSKRDPREEWGGGQEDFGPLS